MRTVFVIGALGIMSACGTVGTVGGNYDGVPLEATDTLTCPNIPGEISAPAASAREQQLRCTPQSQPLVEG